MSETKLPKLPRGWRYERHECMSDGSGGPWIEARAPGDDADYISVETPIDNSVVKWGSVSIFLRGSEDPYSPRDLQRLVARVKALREVAAKLHKWAATENRRSHEPVYSTRDKS